MSNRAGEKFDAIVVGAGAAGLSTALWCAELGLSALVLEREWEAGGQLLRVYNPINNHLGVETENGRALRDIFLKQIAARNFSIRFNAEVEEYDLKDKKVFLTDKTLLSARSMVVATGVRRRKLNVAGEDEFKGRGVIESGKQSAGAVKNKRVVIVGGGDAAAENALILAPAAAHVRLVHRRREFTARAEFLEKIENNPKIEILAETTIEKISGGERLEAVTTRSIKTGEVQLFPADALLIRIGVVPNTENLRGKLALDKNGYIEIDRNCETSAGGVFAVGDVANPLSPTVSSAVGMGATAAKTIFPLLNYRI